MKGKNIKLFFILAVNVFLFSCTLNPIDKLIKEANDMINKNNIIELTVIYTPGNIKETALVTRFQNILDELDNQEKNMTVKQLEKYMLLLDRIKKLRDMLIGTDFSDWLEKELNTP
jgi:hypothetical protein